MKGGKTLPSNPMGGNGYLLYVVVTPNSLNSGFIRLTLLCGDKASEKRNTSEGIKSVLGRRPRISYSPLHE